MKKSELTISVGICTYNGERYIRQQLESIVNQSHRPDEIIICDDGSTDATVALCEAILSKIKIKYIIVVNEQNLGYTKNFSKVINLCKNDIIFLSDQDDVWMPDKVQIILDEFSRNDNCNLVFSDALLVDSELNSLNQTIWGQSGILLETFDDRDKVFEFLLKRNFISGSTLAIRSCLKDYFNPISELYVHDYWISMISFLVGEISGIQKPLILYRQHDNNALGIKKKSVIKTIRKSLQTISFTEINKRYNQLAVLTNKIDSLKNEIKPKYYSKIYNKYNYFEKRHQLQYDNKLKALQSVRVINKCGYYKEFGNDKAPVISMLKDIVIVLLRT